MIILSKNLLFLKNYKIINLIFAGIFALIFIYSGIFSAQKDNYPISSACIVKPCKSTGLSRGFSETIRLNFNSAKKYNKNTIPIFLFFLIQLILRILITLILTKYTAIYIIYIDLILSIIMYFYCFRGILF